MRTRGLVAVVSAALLLAAAGCGGSSAKTAPDTPKQLAADKALAQAAVLKLSDLPAGYKATPHDSSSDSDTPAAVVSKFATCTKVPKNRVADLLNGGKDPKSPSVDSSDFNSGDPASGESTGFENTVELDRSPKDLQQALDLFGAKSALSCWKDFFTSAIEQTPTPGATYSGVSVAAIPTGSVGDQSAAFSVKVTISGASRSLTLYEDFFLVRSGRAGVFLLAEGEGHQADRSLALSLLDAVVGRVQPGS